MNKNKKKTLPIWPLKKPLYLTPKDERYKKYQNQLKKSGFSDTELWGLDYSIAAFVLPRLIRFKEILHSHPANLTFEQWKEVLDKIILAMEITVNGEDWERNIELIEGVKLFGEYFTDLWD